MSALSGIGVGLLVFLPAYLLWGTGAGDVKLIAAECAFLGPYPAFVTCLCILIAGGVLGLIYIVMKKGLSSFLGRYLLMLRCLLLTGRIAYIPPAQNEAAAAKFPYAVAITAGTFSALYWLSRSQTLHSYWG